MPTWRFIILLWNWRLYWAFIMARSPFEKTTSKYAKWLRLSKNASGTPIRHVSMAVTYSRHMNLGLPPISNDDIGIQTNMLLINIFDIFKWNFQSSVANQDYWQKMPRRADAGFFTCSLALKPTRSKRHKSCYLGILNWRSIAKRSIEAKAEVLGPIAQ